MADQTKLEQMLEKLVNNDRDGADQLFHEFVIEKSRSIYEKMLESDLEDLEVDEATDEEVDESEEDDLEETTDEEVDESEEDDLDEATDEEVEEDFDEFTQEADPMGGDATDDMMGDIEADGEEEMDGDDEELEDRVVDLEDALDDLKAEFEKMMSGDDEDEGDEDEADMDMDDEGDEEAEEESYDPSTLGMPAYEGKKSQAEQMREYVEKVAAPKGEDNKAKSPVAGKNDMGGTTANIAQGGDEAGGKAAAPKEDNMGNVNVPGGKASKSMSNAKAPAKGESGANTKSTIGS